MAPPGDNKKDAREQQRDSMCGIVGFLDRTGGERQALGQVLLKMLMALGCRGPDSAGVALYGNPAASGVVVRVKLGERGAFDEKGQQVAERVRSLAFGDLLALLVE